MYAPLVLDYLEATWSVAQPAGVVLVGLLVIGAIIHTRPQRFAAVPKTAVALIDAVTMQVARYIVYGLAIGGLAVMQGLDPLYGAVVPVVATVIGLYQTRDETIDPDLDSDLQTAQRGITAAVMIGAAGAAIMTPIQGFGSLATVMILGVIFWRI